MNILYEKFNFPKVDQSVHDKYQKQHDDIIAKVIAGEVVALIGNATLCHSCGKLNVRGWVCGCQCGGIVEHGFLVKNGSDDNSFMTKEEISQLTIPLVDAFSGEALK